MGLPGLGATCGANLGGILGLPPGDGVVPAVCSLVPTLTSPDPSKSLLPSARRR